MLIRQRSSTFDLLMDLLCERPVARSVAALLMLL